MVGGGVPHHSAGTQERGGLEGVGGNGVGVGVEGGGCGCHSVGGSGQGG